MAASLPGRWVSTFASDIQPGDKIRRRGVECHVLDRTRTPLTVPTFRLVYRQDGAALEADNIAKVEPVKIWDSGDGRVAARVVSLSAAAAIGGNSGSQGIAGGFA